MLAQRDELGRVLARKLERLSEVERALDATRHELDAWRASRGYLLIQAFGDASKSWRDALNLPRRVLRLLTLKVVPLVEESPPPPSPVFRTQPAKPGVVSPLRLLAIVDEFTEQCLWGECQLSLPGPGFSESDLDACEPELLLVESAWRGNRGAWAGYLDGDSPAFHRLLHYARTRGIATVFWNKEDPVHFDHFLDLARHFDHVLTTAVECIPRYREVLKSARIGVMPFACQPAIHNPLEARGREAAFVFAGSYYPQYPQRNAALATMVEALSKLGRVDIFDRNLNSGNECLAFPAHLAGHVVGTLDSGEIDSACKSYRFALNVNTVTDSATMLARRVFELLASGTQLISNRSLAMTRLCGDIVVVPDENGDWLERIRRLMSEEGLRRRVALAGVRKMLSEHTWTHRISRLAAMARNEEPPVADPDVVCVAPVRTEAQARRVLDMFVIQQLPNARLLLVAEFPVSDLPPRCTRVTREQLGRLDLAPVGALAGFWHGDWYGPHYLIDMVLARAYARGDGVGKAAYWSREVEGVALRDGDARYRACRALAVRRALLFDGAARFQNLLQICDLIEADGLCEGSFDGLDEFNYCAGSEQGPAEARDDLEGLDMGLTLERFVSCVDDEGSDG